MGGGIDKIMVVLPCAKLRRWQERIFSPFVDERVEEYVACKMYPLAVGFGFESVPIGMTPMSKVENPLPPFAMSTIDAEHDGHVLAEVETEDERVLGSFRPREYDALVAINILNGGHPN
jgi:hypothetical protein